jgi:hypothetical protein
MDCRLDCLLGLFIKASTWVAPCMGKQWAHASRLNSTVHVACAPSIRQNTPIWLIWVWKETICGSCKIVAVVKLNNFAIFERASNFVWGRLECIFLTFSAIFCYCTITRQLIVKKCRLTRPEITFRGQFSKPSRIWQSCLALGHFSYLGANTNDASIFGGDFEKNLRQFGYLETGLEN